MELPGLERLIETCRVRNLSLRLETPRSSPLAAGTIICGYPLDPVLAAVYTRLGGAAFALDAAGMGLQKVTDEVNELESRNRSFRDFPQPELAMPLFTFGGEAYLAYDYATVPGLADERGHQPVVKVDCYTDPYALPVASNVDTFFGAYASYLEALVSHPEYEKPMDSPIIFPWDVPDILARDERLMAMLRAGRFDPFLRDKELRDWAATLLRIADSRP